MILRDRKVTRLAQGLAVRRSQTVLKGKCSNSQFSAVHFYFKKVITGTWTGADCPKSHTHACTTEPPGTPHKHALPPFTSSLCKWHHALIPNHSPFPAPSPSLGFWSSYGTSIPESLVSQPQGGNLGWIFLMERNSPSPFWSAVWWTPLLCRDGGQKCQMLDEWWASLVKGKGCWLGLLWISVYCWFRKAARAKNANIWGVSHRPMQKKEAKTWGHVQAFITNMKCQVTLH